MKYYHDSIVIQAKRLANRATRGQSVNRSEFFGLVDEFAERIVNRMHKRTEKRAAKFGVN